MNSTDKFISRKLREIEAKGGDEDTLLHRARHYKFEGSIAIAIMIFGTGVFLAGWILPLVDKARFYEARHFFNLLGIIFTGVGSYILQRAKTGKRFYKLVDTYRDKLTSQGVRSIVEFARSEELTQDEVVSELKELQDVGLFRQFSIDRRNMLFIENAGWGELGSADFVKSTFKCSSCGASNSIFLESKSTSATCEYCGTSVVLV